MFKDALVKAANNALGHLKNGCVSDPDPRKVHLFHLAGRTKDGLDKVRSARGTNRNEGYHQRLLQLLGAYNTSPLLAHYVLLLHNYRRNHRMAGKLSFCRLNLVSSSWVCSVCKQAEVTQSGIGGRGMANFV